MVIKAKKNMKTLVSYIVWNEKSQKSGTVLNDKVILNHIEEIKTRIKDITDSKNCDKINVQIIDYE
ncbi:unnamed protein product [marine sediment metagenome]|uniref:Uncharacterized protein n=1 Tax=marine sediment metagenome TaxID=412755 RepID=X0UN05_9ZZZZ